MRKNEGPRNSLAISSTPVEVAKTAGEKKVVGGVIPPPNFQRITFRIEGTAPLVIHKFSAKVAQQLADKHAAGGVSQSKRNRAPKNFDDLYKEAFHVAKDGGWYGFSVTGIRHAMVSACRTVNYKMTHAKLGFWVVPDGFDEHEGVGLIRIYGTPQKFTTPVRNETGVVDIRIRPRWEEWHADVTISYDADMFAPDDIAALMQRAGMQVGICEGRPDSKNSPGMGWGTFTIVTEAKAKAAAR